WVRRPRGTAPRPVSLRSGPLAELTDTTMDAMRVIALLRDDADRAVRLEDRGIDAPEIWQAMLASSHLDLLDLDAFVLEHQRARLSVAHQDRGLLHDEPAEQGNASHIPIDDEIDRDEGRGRDQATGERDVARVERVLHGVGDDENDHQVRDAHLTELALAGD